MWTDLKQLFLSKNNIIVMGVVHLFVIILLIHKITGQKDDCELKVTCRECMQHVNCAWCIKPKENDTPHCMPKSSIDLTSKCKSGLINPEMTHEIIEDRPFASGEKSSLQIKPQKVRVTLRKDETYTLKFQYKLAENYPVDLYYLMDMSYSMRPHKEKLANLGNKLALELSKLTNNLQLGFGSFVDKVDLPFVMTTAEKLRHPCSSGQCTTPYSYKNHMSLNKNLSNFGTEVHKALPSGNLDSPEGGFDALMQAIVCKETIGWRPRTRHFVVYSSDADFHIAGDGKLAGVVEPNDGKCHMEDDMYTEALTYDYPSISHINYVAKQNDVNIIFAIVDFRNRNNLLKTYEEVSKAIEHSNVGQLDDTSENVVTLITDSYKKIVDSVYLTIESNKDVDVKLTSNCKNPRVNGCEGVKVGHTIDFMATITPVACSKIGSHKRNIVFKPNGINETLDVEVNVVCDCPCEYAGDPNFRENASECKNQGNLECGVCNCKNGHRGKLCECNSSQSSVEEDETNCKDKNSTLVCSGPELGRCECGVCRCNLRKNPKEIVSGKYCECDNYSCKRENDKLCSDHGTCECGRCNCFADWEGEACACPNSNKACIADKDPANKICSGNGNCSCGICDCKDGFSGLYCENCPTCPGRCKSLEDCVKCQAFNEGYSENECRDKCTSFNVSLVDVISENSYKDDVKTCTTLDKQGCKIVFQYSYEFKKVISKKDLMVKVQKERTSCPASLAAIMGTIIGSMLLAGLILLIGWKTVTTVHDRREYVKFQDEQKESRWHTDENPLYKGATTTFHNPLFSRRSVAPN